MKRNCLFWHEICALVIGNFKPTLLLICGCCFYYINYQGATVPAVWEKIERSTQQVSRSRRPQKHDEHWSSLLRDNDESPAGCFQIIFNNSCDFYLPKVKTFKAHRSARFTNIYRATLFLRSHVTFDVIEIFCQHKDLSVLVKRSWRVPFWLSGWTRFSGYFAPMTN